MKAWALAALMLAQAGAGDGWSTLKGREEIEVYRDGYGIPHVFAKSVEDAFWAEGYLESQDRLWQMETFRRAAKGESAELLGPKALAQDLDRRRRGYTEAELQAMFESGSARFRTFVESYCAGVNAFLKEGKLPPKYAELKHVPRPWTPTDCVAIGVLMARRFGEAGDVELQLSQLAGLLRLKHGEETVRTMLRDLLRDSDPTAPTTLNDQSEGGADRKHNRRDPAPGMSEEAFAAYGAELEAIEASRAFVGVPSYFGSNAWVVGPKRSATGRAMLYGGPMMGFGTPSICNQIHLVAPGLNVAGMSFPGAPGVMIGFNEHIAYTTTSGGADLVDVFTLELNPENPDEYRHAGGWRRLESFEAVVKVAGGEPTKETVLRSVYGPLVGARDLKNHRAHSVAMSFWKQEHRTFEAVMDFNVAKSTAEFAASVGKVTTSHNWFVADREGHIGFWYAGAHPVRRKEHDPRMPQKGDGSMDWEGLLPFEKWPQSIDPANGFFTNWNNKPARDWEPTPFGRVFWGKRMADVIGSKERVTFEEFTALARETAYHDFVSDYVMPYLLEAAEGEVAEVLKKHDRVKRDGDRASGIVERWTEIMIKKVFDELGPAAGQRQLRQYLASPLLYVLEGEKSAVKLKHDWAKGLDLKAACREALAEAATTKGWSEPEVDFGEGIGKVKSEKGRGTFQMAVEMGKDGPRAVTIAPPGQSESPDSPHFKDQVERFRAWTYEPFRFKREEMK